MNVLVLIIAGDCAYRALEHYSAEREQDGEIVEVKLHQFEIASLSNLNPEERDEADAIIPSLLRKFNEDQVDEVLEIVRRTSGFQNA